MAAQLTPLHYPLGFPPTLTPSKPPTPHLSLTLAQHLRHTTPLHLHSLHPSLQILLLLLPHRPHHHYHPHHRRYLGQQQQQQQ